MPLRPRVTRPQLFEAYGWQLREQLAHGDDALRLIAATTAPLVGTSLEDNFQTNVAPAADALDLLDRPEDAADHAAMVTAAREAGIPIDSDRATLPGPDEPAPPFVPPDVPGPSAPIPITGVPPPPEGPTHPPPHTPPEGTPPPPEGTPPPAGPTPPPEGTPPPGGPHQPGPTSTPPPEAPPIGFEETPVSETYGEAFLQGEAMRIQGRPLTRGQLAWIAKRLGHADGAPVLLSALRAFVADVEASRVLIPDDL